MHKDNGIVQVFKQSENRMYYNVTGMNEGMLLNTGVVELDNVIQAASIQRLL